MNEPLYIVDIMQEVVASVDVITFPLIGKHIDFIPGRSSQIIKKLIELGTSSKLETKAKKYPLFALFMDFPENNTQTFYHCTVKFPKISIANFTDHNWPVLTKYANNFKPILYPIYTNFLTQLSRHKNIVGVDFPHIKWDRPGVQPADPSKPSNFNDYVDAIEINNLDITFKQVRFCKQPN